MKQNPLQRAIAFVVQYIWIVCAILIVLESGSTLYSAGLLLRQNAATVLEAQTGEVSGRVDGVLRLLNGLATDEIIGDTTLPLFDRVIRTRSLKESYGLYMIALLDKEFNVVSSEETAPPKEPFSLAQRDYLQRMRQTQSYQITDMIIAGADNKTKNYTIAVPLFKDGELDGGVFGSIYFDDIEAMLARENRGVFYLMGRDGTIMAGGETPDTYGQTIPSLYQGLWFVDSTAQAVQDRIMQEQPGGFWIMGNLGPAYVEHCNVPLTEWTLVYEARLGMILPMVLPMMFVKILLYLVMCWLISRFGRKQLEHRLADVSHLLDRVTVMQRELFRSEQADYAGLIELTQQGLTDQLTGLATRGVLIQRFSQFGDATHHTGMLCFLDLDDLKVLNDRYGHEVGDAALLHFAQILKRYESSYGGIAARYGGDEFVLTIEDTTRPTGEGLLQTLCTDLFTSLSTKLGAVTIHASVGAAFYPTDGVRLEELISKADLALYTAKRNGKNRYAIFEQDLL